MALTTALIQIRTSLIPPPEPGHNDYSDCQQSLTVKYIDSNTRTEKEKNIRRPYPKYAVRTLETKRSDQIIEFDKFWTIERELGVGSFGAVYRVRVFSTGHTYAIKILRKNDFATIRNVQQLLREIAILGSVSHPNIVRLYELLETRDLYIMVQEDCRGGELLARLTALPQFPESLAKQVMRCLFSALIYLHERHIVHRDLKLENILLADDPESGLEDWTKLRIADFGLANFAETGRGDLLRTRCGTFHYMPPEIIRGRSYGPAVDMWSAGVILFILLSGCYPFDAEDATAIMSNIKRGKWEFPEPDWVSVEALDLMGKLMVVEPEKRLTPQEALKHPWFSDGANPHGSPLPHDQTRWLSNIRKNHVVRNYIRKIVTKEASEPGRVSPPVSPVAAPPVPDMAQSWPATMAPPPFDISALAHQTGVLGMDGLGPSLDTVASRAVSELSETEPSTTSTPLTSTTTPGSGTTLPTSTPALSIHKRRTSSASAAGYPVPSPVISTLAPQTPHSAATPQYTETPTPALADDKAWFHIGLPRMLNDMTAVFQAQLSGQDHVGLHLLRSSRGKSTDDYFRHGIGASPLEVAPHAIEGPALRERYRRESIAMDAEKMAAAAATSSANAASSSSGSGASPSMLSVPSHHDRALAGATLSMDPLSEVEEEEDDNRSGTPTPLGTPAPLSMGAQSAPPDTDQRLPDLTALKIEGVAREQSTGAGSDMTAFSTT